jgi:hypothetical protein
LLSETKDQLLEKIRCWKAGLEERGLRVNIGKTKVMKCQARNGLKEGCGAFPCCICRRNVEKNSVECVVCKKWVHKKCSDVKGKLKRNQNVQCFVCVGRVVNKTVADTVLVLDNAGQLDCVDRCYLGDVIEDG